jgi:hypothetical protein
MWLIGLAVGLNVISILVALFYERKHKIESKGHRLFEKKDIP